MPALVRPALASPYDARSTVTPPPHRRASLDTGVRGTSSVRSLGIMRRVRQEPAPRRDIRYRHLSATSARRLMRVIGRTAHTSTVMERPRIGRSSSASPAREHDVIRSTPSTDGGPAATRADPAAVAIALPSHSLRSASSRTTGTRPDPARHLTGPRRVHRCRHGHSLRRRRMTSAPAARTVPNRSVAPPSARLGPRRLRRCATAASVDAQEGCSVARTRAVSVGRRVQGELHWLADTDPALPSPRGGWWPNP